MAMSALPNEPPGKAAILSDDEFSELLGHTLRTGLRARKMEIVVDVVSEATNRNRSVVWVRDGDRDGRDRSQCGLLLIEPG